MGSIAKLNFILALLNMLVDYKIEMYFLPFYYFKGLLSPRQSIPFLKP